MISIELVGFSGPLPIHSNHRLNLHKRLSVKTICGVNFKNKVCFQSNKKRGLSGQYLWDKVLFKTQIYIDHDSPQRALWRFLEWIQRWRHVDDACDPGHASLTRGRRTERGWPEEEASVTVKTRKRIEPRNIAEKSVKSNKYMYLQKTSIMSKIFFFFFRIDIGINNITIAIDVKWSVEGHVTGWLVNA